jgi:hypothetical protein
VHAFADAAAAFFIPALATCLGAFSSKKLFTQAAHVI